MYQGVGVSEGIAIGKVLLISDDHLEMTKDYVEDSEAEVQRLGMAIEKSKEQLADLVHKADGKVDKENLSIIETHILILSDGEYTEKMRQKIRSEKVVAHYAVKEVTDHYIEMFNHKEDEYIRERGADLSDVGQRIISNLMEVPLTDFSKISNEMVLIAKDLKPSDIIQLASTKVVGLAAERGGRTSHSAILARAMGIPAVVGIDGLSRRVKNGDTVIVDGNRGDVYINPDTHILEQYRQKIRMHKKSQSVGEESVKKPAITLDGSRVSVFANVFSTDQGCEAMRCGAEGIGLYRTEFLYLYNKGLPSEEQQFEEYRRILDALKGRPVIIRTLDIGGDKSIEGTGLYQYESISLGARGIRASLEMISVFQTQLRAILRAGVFGDLRLMYPMITTMDELDQANKILNEEKEKLKEQGIEYANDIKVGMVVETPSAAVMSDSFAKKVDFFSIGTNDLIQYTLAVDRSNQREEDFFDAFHPAVLRLINLTIDNAHKNNIKVGVCGEMAGDLQAIPLLVGMGIDELSMDPRIIPAAKKLITGLNREEWAQKAKAVLKMYSINEVRRFLGYS